MKHSTLLLGLLMSIILLSSFFIIFHLVKTDYEKLEVNFEVGESAGFDLTNKSLNFGRLIPGSSGTRSIVIQNVYEDEIKVSFGHSHSLNGLISYERGWKDMRIGESMNYSFSLIVPEDMEYGNYTGEIEVRIIK